MAVKMGTVARIRIGRMISTKSMMTDWTLTSWRMR